MVYDPVRRCVLLYGGKGSDDVNRSELWSFDTATRDWSQLEPQGLPPKAREDHTLVLDLANDQLVLYGGENGPTSNETWTFDLKSNRWTNITHDSAPALESHVAIYDPKGKRMVVFGGMQEKLSKKGEKEREIQDDTWTLDLAQGSAGYGSWTKVPVTAKPSARREHKGAYDPTRYRMIIFGGRQRSRASFLDDVWTLDLATMIWHEIEAGGEKPDPIRQMALGYDPTANTLTVFGGEVHITLDKTHEEERTVNQVWVLELDSGVWSDRTPYPRPMYDHVGTFVPELGGTLIYGGSAHKLGKEHATWLIRPR